MTLEKQLGSILKKLKNTVTNIIEIEGTVNSRAESVDTINKDVQAKAEEMKKYVDTMNASVNTLNTLETQISDLKTSVSSTTDRAEKMLKETQAIRDTLTDALVWKGSVENYAALPTKNVRVGDTYNVTAADSAHNINAGDNVVWDGSKWDVMGGIMNVDSLAVKGQDANFKDVTATTFHGALNGKADSATTADVAKTVAWNNIGGKPATFPSDIQLDDVPTEGSVNAVKSSGIKSALDEKISTAGGTLTGNLELSDSNVAISTKGGAISGGDTSISLSSKGTVDFTDSNTGTRTSYISTSDGKYHGDIIGNADRATLAVNDDAGNNIADTYAKKTDLPTVPTKVSAFTNDAGYLTSHQSLAGYASLSKANSYTGVNTFGGATQLNETKIYGTTSFYANNAVVATIAGNQFSGNAATATKATLDASGNVIVDTYETKTNAAAFLDGCTEAAINGLWSTNPIGTNPIGTKFIFNKNDNMGPIRLVVDGTTYILNGYKKDIYRLFDIQYSVNHIQMFPKYDSTVTPAIASNLFDSNGALCTFFRNHRMKLTKESDGSGILWSSPSSVNANLYYGNIVWNHSEASAASQNGDWTSTSTNSTVINNVWDALRAAYRLGENLVIEFLFKS